MPLCCAEVLTLLRMIQRTVTLLWPAIPLDMRFSHPVAVTAGFCFTQICSSDTGRALGVGSVVAGEWKIRSASRRRELKPPQLDIHVLTLSREALVLCSDEKRKRICYFGGRDLPHSTGPDLPVQGTL